MCVVAIGLLVIRRSVLVFATLPRVTLLLVFRALLPGGNVRGSSSPDVRTPVISW